MALHQVVCIGYCWRCWVSTKFVIIGLFIPFLWIIYTQISQAKRVVTMELGHTAFGQAEFKTSTGHWSSVYRIHAYRSCVIDVYKYIWLAY